MGRILTKEELLALPKATYNKAMVKVWPEMKVKHNLSGDLRVCKYCGRYCAVFCICAEAEESFSKMIEEVRRTSED